MRLAHLAFAGAAVVAATAVAADDQAADVRAAAAYEEGRRLYNARDYVGALVAFDEAIRIDPDAPALRFARGLALKKLGRDEDARAAFLESRRLDPDYKRAEIDRRLAESGAVASSPPETSGAAPLFGIGVGEAAILLVIGTGLCLVFVAVPLALYFGVIRKGTARRPARRLPDAARRDVL